MLPYPLVFHKSPIIKGGAGHFVHLAGQLTSATQNAAGAISQEVITGNRSFDNQSFATSQMFNNSGFKTDLNASTHMGHQEYQQPDGTIVKETLSGHSVFHAGSGVTTSTGSKSVNMNIANTSALHESIGHEKSLMDAKQMEYSTLKQSMYRQASEFVARLANAENSGEHFNYGQNSSDGKVLSNVIDKTKELSARYGYSWNQAAELGISGAGGVKFGPGNKGDKLPSTEEARPEGIISKLVDNTKTAIKEGLLWKTSG